MSYASFFGVVIGIVIWGGLISVVLKLMLKQMSRRTINSVALVSVSLLSLPLGFDQFITSVIGAIPVWFLFDWLDRRSNKPGNSEPTKQNDDPTTSSSAA